MLVLDRRVGERLLIGEQIELKVISLKPGRVQLGIEAPESMAIRREEIEAQQKEQGRDEPSPE